MNNTNIPNSPHVICFRASDARLRAVNARFGEGLDERFAIYPTRNAANLAIAAMVGDLVDADAVTYFSVPASVLFDTETKVVYTIRG